VHGDYDVDGICATALYVRALREMGARAEPFVPNRLEDGYDLTEAGIRAAVACGATLILTGDCGIVAHGAVDRGATAGDRCDRDRSSHAGSDAPGGGGGGEPEPARLRYPDKGLAGVGVAYKVCCASRRRWVTRWSG
jgi:single-stranded-DNA-specific exonuclease